MLINVKMPTIVGILTFMSRISVMVSWVEYEKKFYNLGPDGFSHSYQYNKYVIAIYERTLRVTDIIF